MKEKIELYNRLLVVDPKKAHEMLVVFMSDEADIGSRFDKWQPGELKPT